jgi:hypothetical protein
MEIVKEQEVGLELSLEQAMLRVYTSRVSQVARCRLVTSDLRSGEEAQCQA